MNKKDPLRGKHSGLGKGTKQHRLRTALLTQYTT